MSSSSVDAGGGSGELSWVTLQLSGTLRFEEKGAVLFPQLDESSSWCSSCLIESLECMLTARPLRDEAWSKCMEKLTALHTGLVFDVVNSLHVSAKLCL